MLTIVQAPHPVLSQKARKINKADAKIRNLIKEMTYTLEHTTNPEGVGLAAPQVGEPLQLFIIKVSLKSPLNVFINPEILSVSEEKYPVTDMQKPINNRSSSARQPKADPPLTENKGIKLEGCLSLKDIWGVVHRSSVVKITYTDEAGRRQTKTFSGFLATIIQHECDHLQGILFPKRVLEQKEKLYKATTDENGEMVFEEMAI